MPALTEDEYEDRTALIRVALGAQPAANLIAAGCCPSLTIVDYGLPTQHVVYCEKFHPGPGFTHDGLHQGLAGVDVPGWRTAPVAWQWDSVNP